MKKWNKTVAIALWKGSSVLMSQRLGTETFPNLWQFPGGKVDPPESVLRAIIREVLEETGLKLDMQTLDLADCIKGDPSCYKCFLFESIIPIDQTFHNPESKNSEWRLIPFEEAVSMASEGKTLPGIYEYFKEKLWLTTEFESVR